jgi:hypothetical protein
MLIAAHGKACFAAGWENTKTLLRGNSIHEQLLPVS